MSLAMTLKRLRLKKNLSLQQVADKVGASKAHIWDLETGNSKNPTLKLLQELADLFEIPLSRLVGEIPDENNADHTDDDRLVIFRNLKNLDSSDLETLKRLTEAMKAKEKDKEKG